MPMPEQYLQPDAAARLGGDFLVKKQTEAVGSPASFAIWIFVSVLVIVFDQLTKWAIVKWLPLYSKIEINSFINITHQQNTGAAFSFLANAGG